MQAQISTNFRLFCDLFSQYMEIFYDISCNLDLPLWKCCNICDFIAIFWYLGNGFVILFGYCISVFERYSTSAVNTYILPRPTLDIALPQGEFNTTARYNASIGFTSLGEQSSLRVVMMWILGFWRDEIAWVHIVHVYGRPICLKWNIRGLSILAIQKLPRYGCYASIGILGQKQRH